MGVVMMAQVASLTAAAVAAAAATAAAAARDASPNHPGNMLNDRDCDLSESIRALSLTSNDLDCSNVQLDSLNIRTNSKTDAHNTNDSSDLHETRDNLLAKSPRCSKAKRENHGTRDIKQISKFSSANNSTNMTTVDKNHDNNNQCNENKDEINDSQTRTRSSTLTPDSFNEAKSFESNEEPEEYESANETSFNEQSTSHSDPSNGADDSPSPGHKLAKTNLTILNQRQMAKSSLLPTTASCSNDPATQVNEISNSDTPSSGHKHKRPNFIVINKSNSSNGGNGSNRDNKPTFKVDNSNITLVNSNSDVILTQNMEFNQNDKNYKENQIHCRDLDRSKQRASISSCSSIDSYGSGYASGGSQSSNTEKKQLDNSAKALTNSSYKGKVSDDTNTDSLKKSDSDNPSIKSDDSDDQTPVGTPISKSQQSAITHEVASKLSPSIDKLGKLPSPKPSELKEHESILKATLSNTNTDKSSKLSPKMTSSTTSPNNSNNTASSNKITTTPNSVDNINPQTKDTKESSSYHHTLFQWEQLLSKGVSRPLLINDLDFTDLHDEDDCDLLNSNANQVSGQVQRQSVNPSTGEPLKIRIPPPQGQPGNDQLDSGNGSGPNSDASNGIGLATSITAPPPMPPPPMSPWYNTYSGSRPQSQLILGSPTPSYDAGSQSNLAPGIVNESYQREESPANSTYSNYSRNSYCAPHTSTPTHDSSGANNRSQHQQLQHHLFNSMQQNAGLRSASSMSSLLFGGNGRYGNKRKKTMKLFWKEVREDRSLLSKLTKKKTIWDELKPVSVDTQKLEYLFESKAKDLSLSRSRNGLDGLNQRKAKISVLDAKRSNAINIGMTKLPPMRTIKSAILKMDSNIMNREGIEKILTTMMPTEEEKTRIIEAQLANPDTPLGTAEQFLLNLASISALEARLKLWAFQLDYAQIEKEVAEPLMDLKQAIDEIQKSETFRLILGTLLSIGNFLNCSNVKGFQIEYLEKVPEVKDTVHKHSLLHHLCVFMQESHPETSDLYSEFGAVNRASKMDFVEVGKNLKKMQQDCKASWDYLKIVAKHDGLANLMNKSASPSASSGHTLNLSPTLSGTVGNSTTPQDHRSRPSFGKLNNLSKLSMITTITSSENSSEQTSNQPYNDSNTRHTKIKVSEFLTDCAERIMVLMVIHRRVMNRFQKLLVYLGCPSHQIKQTQPQQILKIINEFAMEYRTKRERVREVILKRQKCQNDRRLHDHLYQNSVNRWQLNDRARWAGSHQCLDSSSSTQVRPCSTASSYANQSDSISCCDSISSSHNVNSIQVQQCLNSNSQWVDNSHSGCNDYPLFDQSRTSCYRTHHHQSMTPVSCDSASSAGRQRNLMSVSMFDLQNQQQSQQDQDNFKRGGCMSFNEQTSDRRYMDKQADVVNCFPRANNIDGTKQGILSNDSKITIDSDNIVLLQRHKDEQLRRVLGVGKSFDGACSDLLKMSHWTTTSQRQTRHPQPNFLQRKLRAASIDSPSKENVESEDRMSNYENQSTRQSWLMKSHNNYKDRSISIDDESGQNSDEDILQCLVRQASQPGPRIKRKILP